MIRKAVLKAFAATLVVSSAAFAADTSHLVPDVALKHKEMKDFKPVTAAQLRNPDPADWPMYRRNYQGWGFSPLDQIKPQNVNRLRLVWSRALEPGWQQSTPLIHDGVIFIGTTKDVIQAIDARNGDLIWEHRRKQPTGDNYNMLAGNKRSIALYGDKVYFVSFDNHVVALDAKTGRVVWDTDRGQGDKGVSNSTGPFVVNGVVIAGTTCQYAGFECYVTGHDAASGRELWRNHFLPRKGEPGYDTWGGVPDSARWSTSAWGQITYDPDLNLVYYGSNGAMPAAEWQRKTHGASMAGTNTRFAIRPEDGKIVWSRQVLPRDNWEQDCVFEMQPVTSPVNPKTTAQGMMAVGKVRDASRKVLVGAPCKTGIVFSLDAQTGQFLWAKATVPQNLVTSIDGSGLVKVNESMVMTNPAKLQYTQCPGYGGGRDWPASAYNPAHNLVFLPSNNMCNEVTVFAEEAVPEAAYNSDVVFTVPEGVKGIGRIDAISVGTGETVWTYHQPAVLYSPVLATGGDLLFTGGFDRYFRALSQTDGKVLWETRLPSQVTGHAVSYGIDGKQYIAVPTGGGLVSGYFQPLQADVDGAIGANALFVFALIDDDSASAVSRASR